MSSPIQPPPNIRPLSQTQPPASGPAASPYSHHLPPPSLPSSAAPQPPPLSMPLPPPRVSDMHYPSSTGAHPSAAAPSYVGTSQVPHPIHSGMPPPSALASSGEPHAQTSSNMPKSVLPPPIPSRGTSSSPYADPPSRGMAANGPRPQSPAASQEQEQGAKSENRPLNVRDALTYLDHVKVKFSDQPDVYNRFLDIMKDFKSQIIDTPGVIERVSTLFKGHSTLISGFNTFLPPGYRIECSTDPREPDVIWVTTPNGTLTTSVGGSRLKQEPENSIPTSQAHYHQHGYMPPPGQVPMTAHSMHGDHQPPLSQGYPPVSGTHTRPPPPHARAPNSIDTSNPKRPPIEFNHAINYVNKIKNRFAEDPDIYKQFLEILQTYQKEQRPIEEVYDHVQYLFNGAPDLLDEFKQFLPEITGQPADALYGDHDMMGPSPQSTSMMPSGKKKRNTVGTAPGLNGKRSKYFHKSGIDSDTSMRPDPYAHPPSEFDPVRPSVSADEIKLFEHIRKHIGNKPSYEEFLKTLNLYTQQIVDLDTLVDQVEGFIGTNKELFDWFKNVLGFEAKEHPIERPAHQIPKPDLNHCKTVESSPSYRVVPKNWQNQPCSGRDQLAWEVLNDEYLSHPIWASEDDGFLASKKSQYEEAVHRCEEERYDYNLNIEANLNTIALLEPISKKLATMSTEEQANYRLSPGLGGQSKSIYERIIKKVYDKERGEEVIELLYVNPAQTVPVLLKRLKQKDEEWKRAQREWNKIWREQDEKNFLKSLDYQGITFKSNDRKAFTTKALTTEIEALQKEGKAKEEARTMQETRYQFKFAFNDPEVFKDVTRVVYSYIDRQNGFTGNEREKIRTFLRSFIPLCFHVDDVVPEGLATLADDADEDEMMEDDDDDSHSVNTDDSESDAGHSASKRSQSPSRMRNGRRNQEDDHTMDLLRDVLTKNKSALDESDLSALADKQASKSPSAPVEPNPNGTEDEVHIKAEEGEEAATKDMMEELQKPTTEVPMEEDTPAPGTPNAPTEDEEPGHKLLAAAAAATAPDQRKRTVYSLFCNSTFYYFFRLYQLVYERLSKLKRLDEKREKDPEKMNNRKNLVAEDLGLCSNRFDDLDLSNGYYRAFLELIDRFFEGEMDQPLFEETARYLFVTDAYVLFTIDKLIHGMIKQIQAVTVDTKSVELVRLFRGDQALETSSPRILAVYRLRVEEIMGSDEDLYKINFDIANKNMVIQLLGKDDYPFEPSAEDMYEDYVESYMDWVHSTDGVNLSQVKPTFLKRNLRPQDKHLHDIFVRSRLQYKIDQASYHMCYIDGSEDVFIRRHARVEPSKSKAAPRWKQWLESVSA